MKSRNRVSQMCLASAVATVVGIAAVPAGAATPLYATEVLEDNPYVYYRLQETGTLTGAPADESSANNRADGIYRGNPVGGVAGWGASSDGAVSFPGVSNNPSGSVPASALDYLRTTDFSGFGSLVGGSSYEFIFKSNVVNPTNYQSLFGVFNFAEPGRTGNGAVAVEFNSNATGNTLVGSSRFYVRDEDGIALGGTIATGNLLDGNYHHLVFTYDNVDANQQYIKAYVDGLPVAVNLVPQGGGSLTNVPDNFLPFTRDAVFGARNVRGTVNNESDVTIDEAAVFAAVLTAGQVDAHYTSLLNPGDANGNWAIDADDFALIDAGFARYGAGEIPANSATFRQGDFDRNGVIDAADYFLIDTAYYQAHTPSADFLAARAGQFGDAYVASLVAAVPEPSSLAGGALAAMALAARRRSAR